MRVLAWLAAVAGAIMVVFAIWRPLVETTLFMVGLCLLFAGAGWLLRGVDVLADAEPSSHLPRPDAHGCYGYDFPADGED